MIARTASSLGQRSVLYNTVEAKQTLSRSLAAITVKNTNTMGAVGVPLPTVPLGTCVSLGLLTCCYCDVALKDFVATV
jgi:hypothetical protein